MISIKRTFKIISCMLLTLLTVTQVGCATGHTRDVVLGMLGGGAVGAVVGHEFVHNGVDHRYRTQNTIISAVIGALVVGGALAWHYDQMQQQTVAISGEYARYRLCNPDQLSPEVAKKLGVNSDEPPPETLKESQVGKLAISLDDNTKWAYPVFRKRFLPPEKADTQVMSSRYIWEIMRPGSFVTRTQNPQYFVEPPEAK